MAKLERHSAGDKPPRIVLINHLLSLVTVRFCYRRIIFEL